MDATKWGDPLMKKYELKPAGQTRESSNPDLFDAPAARKFQSIGKLHFTFDKTFQQTWQKFPKFIPAKISVTIYENETAAKAIEDCRRLYKNARDFKIEMNQPELPAISNGNLNKNENNRK